MDGMSDALTGLVGVKPERMVQWFILLSFVLPYVISIVQQRAWSKAVRARVSLAVCALAAVAVLFVEDALTLTNWLASATALFSLTACLYKHFAKANGAQALEDATTSALLNVLTSSATSPATSPATPPAAPVAPAPPSNSPSAATVTVATTTTVATGGDATAGDAAGDVTDDATDDCSADELVRNFKASTGEVAR